MRPAKPLILLAAVLVISLTGVILSSRAGCLRPHGGAGPSRSGHTSDLPRNDGHDLSAQSANELPQERTKDRGQSPASAARVFGHDEPAAKRGPSQYEVLPEPYTDEEVRRILQIARRDRIWRSQDQAIRAWPAYSDIRQQLLDELAGEMDLGNSSEEQLIKAAQECRQEFWQADGDLSRKSYPSIYKARILCELALSRDATNLTIMDELAQTIQAVRPLWTFDEATGKPVRHVQALEELLQIRRGQFVLLRKEIRDGRSPTLEDFVRAFDLAVLQSRLEVESTGRTVEWMKREAARGGWSGYKNMLDRFSSALEQGRPYSYNIYAATNADFPKDYRYGRRLPSFRWPVSEQRGIILWGKDNSNLYKKGISVTHPGVDKQSQK